MPFLRVHSEALALEQKRIMAQKLIEITLRAFHLRAEERRNINILFVSQLPASDLNHADLTLEVLGHDLTDEKKASFTRETEGMLTHLTPSKPKGLIERFLGAKADPQRQIALQFHELPLASDSRAAHPQQRAA